MLTTIQLAVSIPVVRRNPHRRNTFVRCPAQWFQTPIRRVPVPYLDGLLEWTLLDIRVPLESAEAQAKRNLAAACTRRRTKKTQNRGTFRAVLRMLLGLTLPHYGSHRHISSANHDNEVHMDKDSENPTAQSSAPSSPATRVLRLKEVCKVTGLGRSYIYQLQADKQFPHSIKIGTRAVGWLDGEVREWLEGRIRSSRPKS
jgi:prophage regulatory protein